MAVEMGLPPSGSLEGAENKVQREVRSSPSTPFSHTRLARLPAAVAGCWWLVVAGSGWWWLLVVVGGWWWLVVAGGGW